MPSYGLVSGDDCCANVTASAQTQIIIPRIPAPKCCTNTNASLAAGRWPLLFFLTSCILSGRRRKGKKTSLVAHWRSAVCNHSAGVKLREGARQQEPGVKQ